MEAKARPAEKQAMKKQCTQQQAAMMKAMKAMNTQQQAAMKKAKAMEQAIKKAKATEKAMKKVMKQAQKAMKKHPKANKQMPPAQPLSTCWISEERWDEKGQRCGCAEMRMRTFQTTASEVNTDTTIYEQDEGSEYRGGVREEEQEAELYAGEIGKVEPVRPPTRMHG